MRYFKLLLKQFVFWMLFFALLRIVFLLYHTNIITHEKASFLSVIDSFYYALKLDVSTTCYILVLPFLLMSIQYFTGFKFLSKINTIYSAIFIILLSLINVAELGVFSEWQTKLHYKSLNYLQHPQEIFQTAETKTSVFLIIILLIIIFLSLFVYLKFFKVKLNKISGKYLASSLGILIIPVLLFVGIRGGVKQIPINQSEVFYSKHSVLNFAAMNSAWNLAYSISHNYDIMDENPFMFYEPEQAKHYVEKLYNYPNDSSLSVLKTNRPNIVIVILESWSATIIESISGNKGFTPEFQKLEKEGILFTNLYASGTRSQQAMSSIFSGFPATPLVDITESIEKYSKLPSFTSELKKLNYNNSFFFGGQLIYGNIKSYLISNGFDRLVELKDFKRSVPRGKLGVHDEFLYSRHIEELKNEKQPFLSALFTLSSHPPYDMPLDEIKYTSGEDKNFFNSIYYADQCLGKYIEEAKKQPWFKNTLFVFVADHGKSSIFNMVYGKPINYRIPLLLYGPVIKEEYKGVKFDKLASQSDIAATLLNQMGLSKQKFFWSKDLFNSECPEFVYYSFNRGFGWIRKDNYFVWDNDIKDFYLNELKAENKDSILKEGKSYLQYLFQEYMDM